MHLTITNNGPESEAIGTPDGSFVDALPPGTGYEVNNDEGVLIIGDKPTIREQFEQAASVVTTAVRHVITAVFGRKQAARDAGASETVAVSISNHGPNPVRVILGDGATDITVEAGATAGASALGYLELRELGTLDESQVDGGTQPGVA